MQEGRDLKRRSKFRSLKQRVTSDFRCDRRTEVTTDISDRNLVTGFILKYSTRKCYFEMSEEFSDDVIVTSRKIFIIQEW
jgi:hypothetical protein